MTYRLELVGTSTFTIVNPNDKYGNSHVGNVWRARSGYWIMSYLPTPHVQYIVGFRSLRDAKLFIEQIDPAAFLEFLNLPNSATASRQVELYPILAMIGPPNEPTPSVICYVSQRELHHGTTENAVQEVGQPITSGQADGGP